MRFAKLVLDRVDRIVPFQRAYAHCDIPCGIYDPHMAQLAAHTVIRMDMLIADAMKNGADDAEGKNKIVRYVSIKEQHAEICKHEVRVLWGDYFKPDHAKAHPELNDLVWNILKLASKAKQSTDVKAGEELLENVEKLAEIFWKTKGISTYRAKAPYPTDREMVYPKVGA